MWALFLLLPATPAIAAPAWLAPVELTAAGQPGHRTTPQVAVDPGGDAVAVWKGYNGADEVIEAASRPAGGSWEAPVVLSASGHSASEPQVAVDSSGDAVAVWKRYNGTNNIVEAASRPAGGSWGAPVELSAAGQAVPEPQVAVNPGGDVVVVWSSYNGTYHIVEAASRPAGGSWGAPVELSVSGPVAPEPQVAVDPSGNAVAVWKRSNGSKSIVAAASRPAGGSWEPPVDLSATGQNAESAQVAVDPGGDAVAVWRRYEGSDFIIEAASRPAGGSWGAPVGLSATGQNAYEPQVAVGPGGNAVAAWYRDNGTNALVEAASRPAGGSWQAPVELSVAGQAAFEPQVAVDAGGNAVAVWYEEGGTNDIVEAAGRPPGGSWQAPVGISIGDGVEAPQIAVEPGGDAVAVWEEYEGGYIVRAAGYDATGPQLRSLSIPAAGTVGQSLAFSVSPFDVWSPLGPVSWNFGDGAGAGGTSVSHTYAAPGNYTVTLSAGDALGNLSSATGQVSITAGAAPGGPAGAGAPLVTVPKKLPLERARVGHLVLVKHGKALLKLTCPAGAGCRGVAKLSVVLEAKGRSQAHARAASLEIGKAAFKIAGAKAKAVPVKLSAQGQARVRAAGKTGGLKAHLTGTGIKERTVVLKEARRG